MASAQRAAESVELPPIELSDRDASAVAAVEANAARAEVADRIRVERRVVAHLPARTGVGLLATNPPYGKRMGSGADRSRLTGLYKRLGAVTRERLPGYGLAVITSDPSLARRADGGVSRVAAIVHGGLRVGFYHRPADSDGSIDSTGPVSIDGVDGVDVEGNGAA